MKFKIGDIVYWEGQEGNNNRGISLIMNPINHSSYSTEVIRHNKKRASYNTGRGAMFLTNKNRHLRIREKYITNKIGHLCKDKIKELMLRRRRNKNRID